MIGELLRYAWELAVTGLLLGVVVGIVAGMGSEYSCAPVDPDDSDGEHVPDDPDRWRGYDLADDAGAL